MSKRQRIVVAAIVCAVVMAGVFVFISWANTQVDACQAKYGPDAAFSAVPPSCRIDVPMP